jgi:phage terminase large subunit
MGRSLTLQAPAVFAPLTKTGRYKGAYGGRGSGKSRFFARFLILRALSQPGMRAVCVREIQKSLEQSVKRLIEDEIIRMGVGDQFQVMETEIRTPGGGLIIFQGLQNHTADSIKSLEGYDIAWVEEAQSLSQRSIDLLDPTIRKDGSELWFSWNPRNKKDPIDSLLRSDDPLPGAIVVRANWRDNPWFPEVLRTKMEWDRRRDPDKYAYIWLGEYEHRGESRVFRNWRVTRFDTPIGATFYFGGDWGFSVDPTVLVRCWIDGRTLYVDSEVYKVGCEIDHTPALFDRLGCASPQCGKGCTAPGHGMARSWTITADSARPETISYMRRNGYPKVKPARKGPGSVEEGVEFLKSYDIVVHERCVNTIDELATYSYKVDRLTDEVLPILEDKKNHVIDSLRYAVEGVRRSAPEGIQIPAGLQRPSQWSPAGYSSREQEEME